MTDVRVLLGQVALLSVRTAVVSSSVTILKLTVALVSRNATLRGTVYIDCNELTPVSIKRPVSLDGDQQNSTPDIILGDCIQQWQFDIKLEAEIVWVCAVGTQELRLDAFGCTCHLLLGC